jgi:hypothetical protein
VPSALIRIPSWLDRFLVSEAMADERSRELLAAQDFGFLRAKAVFGRCMEAAWGKWESKNLSLWGKRPFHKKTCSSRCGTVLVLEHHAAS